MIAHFNIKLITWLSLFFMGLNSFSPAQAYIPRVKTIVGKMAKNNGRLNYKVVRNITFDSGDEQIKATETWLIRNGDSMKLTVVSNDSDSPWSFEIVYNGSKRKTLSSAKSVKEFKKSDEFFEPFFHDRSSNSLLRRLTHHRFIPAWAKNISAPDYKNGKTFMTEEPFVRLEPQSGSVNYALGPKLHSDTEDLPVTLWVEQDSFLIKKGRMRSQAEFTNDNYQTFSGNLKLPRTQTITWDAHTARIQLISANPIPLTKKTMTLSRNVASQLPQQRIVKEFYSRFR